jgi:hypothetical protein
VVKLNHTAELLEDSLFAGFRVLEGVPFEPEVDVVEAGDISGRRIRK